MSRPLFGSVGILGGSFNPVHNGHLRMAIEAREALDLARVELLPAKVPPHKGESGLLDFGLRFSLLRQAVEGVEGLVVNALEGEMPVPSYSYATLSRLREMFPATNYVFVLGSTDFLTLPDWHRGLELPLLTDIAVVDRLGLGQAVVDGFLDTHWDWREEGPGVRRIVAGRRVVLVPMARLDISASMVREKFCAGLETSGLVPEAVRGRMLAEPHLFKDRWNVSP
ncbi:nicotinate (nicotinamide) nucleotide adenylyltransferase [Desulfomicrobium sp. ZS1]|uniref:nicotinate (nicotinamide) nucleotide adenylyltransferase n=1 Tax=Desulfomicrobium sp. ZS1 TaxID=2952228 RepID=UPI0020B23FE7|nr:nicotinate (nicotinamide) nucleotide adenylyltransferase [Desulfomicrobium sp. ZS1]UTF51684.1 nicotinate (nicotinamide) nucleotide adenylyltransferase [Desulfomicrobium sp. ZS1]